MVQLLYFHKYMEKYLHASMYAENVTKILETFLWLLLSEARSRSRKPGLYILHPTMMVLISSCRSQLFCAWQRRTHDWSLYYRNIFNFGPNICGSDKKLRFAAWCCCSHCKFLCFDKNPAKTCKDVAAERGKEDNPEIKNAKYFENGKL